MTIGENIQKYRKSLGLSQEELGQKLLVSRQTISLWEKDQTVPTIDNLIRLKEMFGVSVDEIFGFENKKTVSENKPNEIYKFNFSKEELIETFKLQRKSLVKKPIILMLIMAVSIVFLIGFSAPYAMIGFVFGALFTNLIYYIKLMNTYGKVWNKNTERICLSTYEYKIFEYYIIISIYRNGEKVSEYKGYFKDIENIRMLGKWIFFEFRGMLFLMRKSDLSENSTFYACLYENSIKAKKTAFFNKFNILSLLLFILSLSSIFIGMVLVDIVSAINYLFTENMWLLFLMTPIPIASIIYGFILKSKGYKYLKNIIAGIIALFFLCIYGSFSFIFADEYSHTEEPVIKIEQMLGIDIPEHKTINTQDWTGGTQTTTRGYVYYTSDVYFEEENAHSFEESIQTDNNWVTSLPNELIGITSPFCELYNYDYILIYNVDQKEYNCLPENSGKYRFVNLMYQPENNKMQIVEYDIEYVK